MKLFVDANTLVSGLLFAGNERLLLELGRFGACELMTNDYVHWEVERALARPEFALHPSEQRRLLALVDLAVTVLPDPAVPRLQEARHRLKDATDLPVLLGFEGSGCDLPVTGDREPRAATPRGVTTREALGRLASDSF